MNEYVKLGLAALFPVIAAVLLRLLDKKTKFGKVPLLIKSLLAGLVFGALAIVNNHYGIPINGAQCNVRDACVLIAGLFFGWPAGILAGLLGGVERFIATPLWGIGAYTQIACSVSTFLAGVYAALLRKVIFDNKRPPWILSFSIGVVVEVFHLTMVFVTHLDDVSKALSVVRACTLPMVIFNAVSVMLASIFISILSKEKLFKAKDSTRITGIIQKYLLGAIFTAFAISTFFIFELQIKTSVANSERILKQPLSEIQKEIIDTEGTTLTKIENIVAYKKTGKTGFTAVTESDFTTIKSGQLYKGLITEALSEVEMVDDYKMYTVSINSKEYYAMFTTIEVYNVVSFLPMEEALEELYITLYVNTFLEVLIFAILYGLIYYIIKKVIVEKVKEFNVSLNQITSGNLDTIVNIRSTKEFNNLSNDINTTVSTLKQYIDDANKRIDEELEFAKSIQTSSLPSKFPAFPKRTDFDIYAQMDTAKEVGGDFYDFYLIKEKYLAFLMADVSGKGIPAAMFMMRAKTELKALTETELPLDEVFRQGNDALCQGNDAGMFVTAFQGGLDLATGVVYCCNAGHCPPIVKHKDGTCEYIPLKKGFVLAGLEGFPYQLQQFKLEKGDYLFLYTDGVTEANNLEKELFGEDRLLKVVQETNFENCQEICKQVKVKVDEFANGADQFDDITMLCLQYKG